MNSRNTGHAAALEGTKYLNASARGGRPRGRRRDARANPRGARRKDTACSADLTKNAPSAPAFSSCPLLRSSNTSLHQVYGGQGLLRKRGALQSSGATSPSSSSSPADGGGGLSAPPPRKKAQSPHHLLRPDSAPADIEDVLKSKLKRAKSADRIWDLVVRYERHMSVPLVCLAMIRLRKFPRAGGKALRSRSRGPSSGGSARASGGEASGVRREGLKVLEAILRKRANAMNTRQVATVLHSMAKMGMRRQRSVRERLLARFMLMLEAADAQSVGNTLWAVGKLGDGLTAPQLELLARRLLSVSGSCNSQNLSNAIWSLGTLNERLSERTLELLFSSYVCRLEESVPQGMSNVLWAAARLEFDPGSDILVRIISELISRPHYQVKSQDITNVIWSLGRLQCDTVDGPLLKKLLASSLARAGTFNQQELSMTLWGIARIRDQYEIDPDLYQTSYMAAIEARHRSFNVQALSTTFWALAKIGIVPGPQVLYLLIGQVLVKAKHFEPQGLSSVLWACGLLSYNPGPEALRVISAHIGRRAGGGDGLGEGLSSQGLANTFRSFAVLQYLPDFSVMKKMVEALVDEADNATAQSLCVSLWSFASLKFTPDVEALDAFHQRVSQMLEIGKLSPQHIGNILWSYGTLSYDPEEGFVALALDHLRRRMDSFSPQGIANVLWAVASLGYDPSDTGSSDLGPIVGKVALRSKADEFNSQELVNIVWALSVLENGAHPGFADIWERAMASGISSGTTPQLAQLFHSKLLLEATSLLPGGAGGGDAMRPSSTRSHAHIPDHVEQEARSAWHRVSLKNSVLSRFHSQVSSALHRAKVSHQNEVVTFNGFLSVDILLEEEHSSIGGGRKAQKVVIEVDGPSHFSHNTRRVTGSTLARNKLLHSWGYHVVSIPFYAWPGQPDLQDEYVHGLLEFLACP